MAEAKKGEPKRKYIKGFVYADLWRRFRGALVLNYLSVSEGLEQAIEEWLKVNE